MYYAKTFKAVFFQCCLLFSPSLGYMEYILDSRNITEELITLIIGLKLNIEDEFRSYESPAHMIFTHAQFICQKDEPIKAIASLNEAERLDETFSHESSLLRSRIYMGQGKFESARDEFLKVYSRSRYNLEALLSLRLASNLAKLYQEEIFVLSESVKVVSNSETKIDHNNDIFTQMMTQFENNISLFEETVEREICQSLTGLILTAKLPFPTDDICLLAASTYSISTSITSDRTDLSLPFSSDVTHFPSWRPAHILTENIIRTFATEKYVFLPQILDNTLLVLLQEWSQFLTKKGHLTLEPVHHRITVSSDRLGVLVNHQMAAVLSELIHEAENHQNDANNTESFGVLVPTYSFLSYYLPGGQILPHTDRPQNEYSVTTNIRCPVEWPFHVHHANGTDSKIFMGPGDAVLYKGGEIRHSRLKFQGKGDESSKYCMQLIFGYRRVKSTNCNSQ
mmetsp:Transcript_26446/g.26697  ORF Transcript_26446/g.26697 Transcript_26446/m.26697 type:complete len:453 (+) Transcript_26446:79-1437(+)